jgi:ubiquinone/menaquinone biosynthesis C-methylase UbiE
VNSSVEQRMREDWNARAREDASYYVAFGRRDQDEEEFFATGEEVVKGLEWELRRLPSNANRRAWRALEIGCGPGRIMRPMSKVFGEIHGVDVSDEMVARARANLAGIPHAHPHVGRGSDLAQFADESFELVYSYAVFQHIPSGEVVFNYLREARRVLKTGGLLRVQINGLPDSAAHYDTWSGVRISAGEISDFLREMDFQMFALEGASTQYMWITAMKRPKDWRLTVVPRQSARIRRITNAYSSEPVAPPTGRFATISLWIENLPEHCDLMNMELRVGSKSGSIYYIGPRDRDGLVQINARLPWGTRTGLQPVELNFLGRPLAAPTRLRIIPSPPQVPRIIALSDGINLLSGTHIVTRTIKVTLEEYTRPDEVCTDPIPPRYEINLRLPESIPAGPHNLFMQLGTRSLAPVGLTVA